MKKKSKDLIEKQWSIMIQLLGNHRKSMEGKENQQKLKENT